jgi:hypothetical protein
MDCGPEQPFSVATPASAQAMHAAPADLRRESTASHSISLLTLGSPVFMSVWNSVSLEILLPVVRQTAVAVTTHPVFVFGIGMLCTVIRDLLPSPCLFLTLSATQGAKSSWSIGELIR